MFHCSRNNFQLKKNSQEIHLYYRLKDKLYHIRVCIHLHNSR